MKYVLLAAAFSFSQFFIIAQTDAYRQELMNLADLSRLPLYRPGSMEQLSSWDRTGGNDDGFSGKYSAIRKDPEGWVLADLKGPGVVNRIWTPTPEADTIKFFFDGEATPRISVPFIQLFTGTRHPFIAPLCGNQLGGYFCLLPIPYERSLRIIYTGNNLRFHQTQYRTLSEKEKMPSFSAAMLEKNMDLVKMIDETWGRKTSPLASYRPNLKSKKINITLRQGIEVPILQLSTGGRIVGLEFGAGSDLLQAQGRINIKAIWDGEQKAAIDMPLHELFGFAFGKPAMQSFIMGSDENKLYSYLPMPFDNQARLTLKYSGSSELTMSGTIYYTEEKRKPATEGKFYVQRSREYNIPQASPHLIADIRGRGHYVGTILQAQGLENGSTYYFEGDDITTIDGKMTFHGTGSEDYFNGGYYAVMDKWDMRMSLPTHGAIAYDLATSRTGGYRFYLTDKPAFNESFRLTIEHQPEDKTQVKTDYRSLALFYADKPVYQNRDIGADAGREKPLYRDRLTPQGMAFSLYWNATADFQDPAIVFGLKKMDSWTQHVDIDAVPMAQVSLHELDNGRYKVYVEYGRTDKGRDFSLWQRTRQVSEWIPTDVDIKPGETRKAYAGEIEITDEVKTVTVRKRKGDDNTSVSVYAFEFEKIGGR